MRVTILSIFLMLSNGVLANDECHFKTEHVINKSYEEILSYAIKVKKHGCIPAVLESSKAFSNIPQTDALISALIRYRCIDGCSKDEEKSEQEYFLSSCKKGFIDVCLEIENEDDAISDEKKLSSARKYCELKSSYACFHLGLKLQEKSPEESQKYKKLACEMKSKAACRHLKELDRIKRISNP